MNTLQKIGGLKVALCQMKVIPGRPDLNTKYMISEIHKARKRGVDLIVFPELCVPGYMIGDLWEDDAFVLDCQQYNEQIRRASKGIAVIWGSVAISDFEKGEDGRLRKYNAAFVAQDGKWAKEEYSNKGRGFAIKSLLPEYRIFFDERYFTSLRQEAMDKGSPVKKYLTPFLLKLRDTIISVGVTICEDMWHEDYSLNPNKILYEKGAELLVNISCSPWTWKKDEKRHRVIKALLEECPVPFVYVNNVGVMNNGDNYLIFKGTSNVYNSDGRVHTEFNPYAEGTEDVVIGTDESYKLGLDSSRPSDDEELYNALIFAAREYWESVGRRKIVIALSGGIDSAVCAALWKKAVGKENVVAVNMPSDFNSSLTKNAAKRLAYNLDLQYQICPIQDFVDMRVEAMKELYPVIKLDGLNLENLQARERGAGMLLAISSILGGIAVNCSNKTEIAFGYGTRYGDWGMGPSLLGDVWKGEVYQLARFINKKVGWEIIPDKIIEMMPSAELSADQNVEEGKGDPFFYPYHDALARAFLEFRLNPEVILKWYLKGAPDLFKNLRIDSALEEQFKGYFPDAKSFVADLRHKYTLFAIAAFKRVIAEPIFIVSKRAFGQDYMEVIIMGPDGKPYFTIYFCKKEMQILQAK